MAIYLTFRKSWVNLMNHYVEMCGMNFWNHEKVPGCLSEQFPSSTGGPCESTHVSAKSRWTQAQYQQCHELLFQPNLLQTEVQAQAHVSSSISRATAVLPTSIFLSAGKCQVLPVHYGT